MKKNRGQRHLKTNIQKLSSQDYDEVIKIWEISVRATHLFLSQDDIAFYKPIILKYTLPDIELYGIITDKTKQNQKILGFMGVSSDKVEMLFLNPTYRKKGLGRQLLEFALQRLKIYKIDVNEENPDALAFYLHMGYQIKFRDEFDGNGKPHPILHLEFPHD